MTNVGRVANVGKAVGKMLRVAMIVGDAMEAGGAAFEFAQTGEWSMRQTMAAACAEPQAATRSARPSM